ncbi:uncharacterized protein LOC126575353 [Anopheles aquasalis]|uniref:uncharacterized protein LOC126575353 n=1 Tax=Anopheles aquasalis TaxID=42839 RepID=UPI00215A1E7A|nr:uncharacterized protein LOC126575353 [Anopheles aquasalis]
MYRKAQQDVYAEDIAAIRRQGHVDKGSSVASLNPFLDDHGVMRARGRLENATALGREARTPILLPQKHKVTKLVVRDYHERGLHQGDNVVVGMIHERFWVVNLRAVLKNVKNCCQWCILRAAKPVAPQMAPLPEHRVAPHQPPFTHTGVDYFGPFLVSNIPSRAVAKRWGALFTCMSTRAVHIEVAERLDVDSFLVCLRNFQHRRGKVRHIYSDNGTNFVGAEAGLRRLVADINTKMGAMVAAEMEVEWHFNPPAAPHFGGVWERQIQTVKKALRPVLEAWRLRRPTVEVLRTALINIEYLLNCRPLTHIPVTHEGEEVLTPFHFLIGRAGSAVPSTAAWTSTVEPDDYREAQRLARLFWDQWRKEYLPTLLRRNKRTGRVEPVKEGDLVVLVEDNAPPGEWIKGVVEKTYPAPDGQVHRVDVRTARGMRNRAAIKVAVVDVRQKEDQLAKAGQRKRFVRAPIGTAPAVKQSKVG